MLKRVAIYGRSFDTGYRQQVQQLFDRLGEEGISITIHEHFSRFLKDCVTLTGHDVFTDHSGVTGADCLFSIGGDGTMLDTITFLRDSGIPVLGFNTGRLGFLSGIQMDKVDEAITALLAGEYSLDKRGLLRLETEGDVFGNLNFALNEFTLHKKDSATMMTVHAYINGEFLNTYWADGLIVSTPTGSTAYSLSCAGPIMFPDSENFIITPIAPHNLNVRPVVVSDKSEIRLRLDGRSDNYLISLDARSKLVEEEVELTIRKETFGVNLIRLRGQDFLKTLRHKLMWGIDLRN